MDIKEKANQYHDKGFNCAQGVLSSCAEYTGLDEKISLAIAGALGGGCRCGEICGALSGALLAVGMCCPFNDAENLEAKEKIAELARYVTGSFREEFGNVRCEDLKGKKHTCPELISYAAALAEKTIKEKI